MDEGRGMVVLQVSKGVGASVVHRWREGRVEREGKGVSDEGEEAGTVERVLG